MNYIFILGYTLNISTRRATFLSASLTPTYHILWHAPASCYHGDTSPEHISILGMLYSVVNVPKFPFC